MLGDSIRNIRVYFLGSPYSVPQTVEPGDSLGVAQEIVSNDCIAAECWAQIFCVQTIDAR